MLSIAEEFEEELKKTRAYQEVLHEGELEGLKKGIKEGLKQGIEEGRKEGLKQGIEEGRKEGRKEGLKQGIEEGRKEGREEGELKVKLNTVPLLRRLGLSDKQIASELALPLKQVKSVPK